MTEISPLDGAVLMYRYAPGRVATRPAPALGVVEIRLGEWPGFARQPLRRKGLDPLRWVGRVSA